MFLEHLGANNILTRGKVKNSGLLDIVQHAEYLSKRTYQDVKANRVFFGLSTLDYLHGGASPGDLVVIAARPSMGKTAFALSCARNIVGTGKPVGFLSLEMSREQLMERLLSSESGIDLALLRGGSLHQSRAEPLLAAARRLQSLPLHIEDNIGYSIKDMTLKIESLVKNQQVRAVFLDYLQLLHGEDAGNRNNEIGAITASLKGCATSLRTPIYLLSQLSRNVERRDNKKPILADLRDSGSIEQDADAVIFIYRQSYYRNVLCDAMSQDPTTTDILLEKNRSGRVGSGKVQFSARTVRFFDD